MRELGRLGFFLLGLYFVISPLAGMGSSARFAFQGDADFVVPLLMSLGFWAAFGLLSGSYLMARNRALAVYLFPDDPDGALDVEALLTALVCVLGVYLVIRGLSEVAGALLFAAIMSQLSLEAMAKPIGGVVAALFFAAAGVLFVARARAIARFIYRPNR
jgi:hypothetical protein